MRTCFIILPMTTPSGTDYKPNHFAKVLKQICIPAVKKIRFKPIGPARIGTYPISEEIVTQLHDADLVLCDISSLNPNVLIELGIRRALNKPFAIIKDGLTKEPFNLQDFNRLEYDHKVFQKSIRAKEVLIRGVAQHLRKTATKRLPPTAVVEPFVGAAACGITGVFLSRKEAEGEVLAAVKKTKQRLWILGIGLSQVFSLPENLRTIEKKIGDTRDFDARILLLDALTSTGVFRTLLESSADKVKKILYSFRDPVDEFLDDPYFNEQLYRDFHNAWTRFRDRTDIDNIVRFYSHTPTCWLIVADDTAYFQPYTFGAAPNSDEDGGPIGPLMPVFRFDAAESARPFKILEDHFEKLWATTNTDLFHLMARNADAQRTLVEIFDRHGYWFRQVHGVLHKPGKERRLYPRKRCRSGLEIYVRRNKNQLPLKIEKAMNFSREGLELKLKNIELKKGEIIYVEVLTPRRPQGAGKKEKAGELVKRILVDPYDGRFRARHVRREGEFLVVGLQPVKKRASR